MATWLIIILVLSYFIIGVIIESILEKTELKLLQPGLDKPWLLNGDTWSTNWYMFFLCIYFWPVFLIAALCVCIRLLIRKIVGL